MGEYSNSQRKIGKSAERVKQYTKSVHPRSVAKIGDAANKKAEQKGQLKFSKFYPLDFSSTEESMRKLQQHQ